MCLMMSLFIDLSLIALGWVLYCLAMNKEHQQVCREEIREVLAGRATDDITWWGFFCCLTSKFYEVIYSVKHFNMHHNEFIVMSLYNYVV